MRKKKSVRKRKRKVAPSLASRFDFRSWQYLNCYAVATRSQNSSKCLKSWSHKVASYKSADDSKRKTASQRQQSRFLFHLLLAGCILMLIELAQIRTQELGKWNEFTAEPYIVQLDPRRRTKRHSATNANESSNQNGATIKAKSNTNINSNTYDDDNTINAEGDNINIGANSSSKTHVVALSDQWIELQCPLASELLSISASNQPDQLDQSLNPSGSTSSSIRLLNQANKRAIVWRKNGIKVANAQLGPRVKVNAINGSLIISSAQPKLDDATYECALVSYQGASMSSDEKRTDSSGEEQPKVLKTHRIKLELLVPPRLAPFEFPSDAQVGMKVVLTCSTLKGQQPISFVWLKDNQIIDSHSSALGPASSSANPQQQQSSSPGKSLAQVHRQQLSDKLKLEAAGRHPLGSQQIDYAILSTSESQQINLDSTDGQQQQQQLVPVLSDPNIRVRQADDYSILSIDSLELKHSGRYTCSAQNEAARATHTAQLVINAPSSFIAEPRDADLVSGQTILIDCAASGHPRPTINWHRVRESNGQQWDYVPIYDNLRYSSLPNGSLAITNVTQREQGFYLCTAKNGIGPEVTKLIKLTVHEPAKFSSRFKTLEVRLDERANLVCIASGEHPIQIEWLDLDGNSIGRTNKRFIIDNEPQDIKLPQGPNSGLSDSSLASRLILTRSERADSGHYTCQATNKYGSDRMVINLLVQDVPDKVVDLKVTNVTSSTISLRWQLPFNGNSPVNSYLVQYQSDDPLDDLLNSLNSNELQPSDKQAGDSTGSPIQTTGESDQSSLKDALDTLSVMSSLGENPVEAIDRTLVEMTFEQSATHLVVKDLSSFCVYKLRLAAVNKIGLGEFSEWIRAKTEEAVPASSALKISAIATGPNSIKLTWLPPDRRSWNGQLIGFNIGYRPRDSAFELNKTVEWSAPSLQSMMRDVSSSSSSSSTESSSDSRTLNSQLRTIVSALRDSRHAVDSSGSPANKSSSSRSQLRGNNNSYYLLKQRLRQLLALQQQELVAHLTNLQRSTTYLVWIQAINSRGSGPQSPAITVRTLDDVPPSAPTIKIQSSSATSITIAWSLLSNFISSANHYSLFYRKIPLASPISMANSSTVPPLIDTPIATIHDHGPFIERNIPSQHLILTGNLFLGADQDSTLVGAEPLMKPSFLHSHHQQPQNYQQFVYTLDQLECGSAYELYMTTRNSVGKSEPSAVVTTRTIGEPPLAPTNKNNLFARIGSSEVLLNLASWSTGGCPLTHMTIRYKQAPIPIASASTKVSSTSSTGSIGHSDHSSSSNSSMAVSWPITTSIPKSLLASLNGAEISSDPHLTAKHSGPVISSSENSNPLSQSPVYTLKNLQSSSCYELEIVAHNAAGYTRAQYEFVTSNLNDSRSGFSRKEGVYRIDQRGSVIYSSFGDSNNYNNRDEDHSSFIDQQIASFTGSNVPGSLNSNTTIPLLFMLLLFICLLVSSSICLYRFRDNLKGNAYQNRHRRSSNCTTNGPCQSPGPESALSQVSPGSIGKSSKWRINSHLASTLKRHQMSFMQHQSSNQDQDSPVHYCMRDPNSMTNGNGSSFAQSVSMKDFNLIAGVPSVNEIHSHPHSHPHPQHAATLSFKSYRNGQMRSSLDEQARMATMRARLVSSTPYDDLMRPNQYDVNNLSAEHHQNCSSSFKQATLDHSATIYQTRPHLAGQAESSYDFNVNDNCYSLEGQQETSWTTNYANSTANLQQDSDKPPKLDLEHPATNYAIPSATLRQVINNRQMSNEPSSGIQVGGVEFGANIDSCIQQLISQQYQNQQSHAMIMGSQKEDQYNDGGNGDSGSSGIDIGPSSEVASSALGSTADSKCNLINNIDQYSAGVLIQQQQQS